MKIKWKSLANFEDILYEYHKGIAKITITDQRLGMHFDPKQLKNYKKHLNLAQKIPM